MTSQLDQTGLTVSPKAQTIQDLIDAYKGIYGDDINVDSNSPDGQLINIQAQAITDLLEQLLDTYNASAVDTSYGERLDQLVALNGLARQQGTYTLVYVTVTATQALTLPGLDQTDVPAFTVADNAGNQFQLVTSYVFGAAGSASLLFQAVEIGEINITVNTITNIITSTLGISTVNNPSTTVSTTGTTSNGSAIVTSVPTTASMVAGMTVAGVGVPDGATVMSVDSSTQFTMSVVATASGSVSIVVATAVGSTGVNEETDAQLKVRHAQSFALASTGPSDAMEGALKNIAGVTDAFVVENNTGSPSGGIDAHTVWPIVNGGTNLEIASAIYAKKSPGCGLKGTVSQVITRPNGQSFTAQWDVAVAQPLYIAFGVIWRGAQVLSNADIATALAAALSYKLGQSPSIGDIQMAMSTIAPTAIVTIESSTQGVSDDGSTWASLVEPTTAKNYYTVDEANITIS